MPVRDDRFAAIEHLVRNQPRIHPSAPSGAWSTDIDCYKFICQQVGPKSRTLETGCGLSTILFAAWGTNHLCVTPSAGERDAVLRYSEAKGISTEKVSFDLRPSDMALPARMHEGELDLVFIDGCHGFPMSIIDWYYGAGRLRQGGILIVDDIQLPQVASSLKRFLARDPRWQRVRSTPKWSAYRRSSTGPLGEEWTAQSWFGRPAPGPILSVRLRLNRLLSR
jgi:predicted O-methyltransferase YrrM